MAVGVGLGGQNRDCPIEGALAEEFQEWLGHSQTVPLMPIKRGGRGRRRVPLGAEPWTWRRRRPDTGNAHPTKACRAADPLDVCGECTPCEAVRAKPRRATLRDVHEQRRTFWTSDSRQINTPTVG